MPKPDVYKSSQDMKQEQDQTYAQYEAATRRLLIQHNAEDLLPMLGLEEETNDPNNNP